MICSPHEYYSGDEININEMGGECSTYGERGGAYRFWWGNLRERYHLEDRRRLEDSIKMDLQEMRLGHGLD
jgi:hypothetical protein